MDSEPTAEKAPSQLHRLLRRGAETSGKPVLLQAGEVLFEADTPSNGLYLIERGRIRVYIINPSGDRIELATLKKGALIGEMSLLGETTRSANCSAIENQTELLFIDRDHALRVVDTDPRARQELVEILSQRARNLVRFIHDFSHLTALVANGDYAGVQTLINSSSGGDPSIKTARDAFSTMLTRVQQREAELQTTIAELSLEINHQRAAQEVESIVKEAKFKNLKQNAADLRRRLRGD
jgi:CRP-like cAMP-binding protein